MLGGHARPHEQERGRRPERDGCSPRRPVESAVLTSILIVNEDLEGAESLHDGLRGLRYTVESVPSVSEALAHIDDEAVDVVVACLHLDDDSGLELIARLRDRQSDVLGIVVTAEGSLEVALEAFRAGAYDFISKPVTLAKLELAVERAIAYQRVRREVHRLRLEVAAARPVETIIGASPVITELTSMIRRVADSAATVLITGESGSGKELVARAIHTESSRRALPFVAINCAAIPTALLESELFGHVGGAFTDARQTRTGLFVQAGDGTIFLDEIGDMPADTQVKLLRVLQERKLRPVGADHEVAFTARLIAATNRDLETAVEEGRFREDLFYRINVVPITVPPLRARPLDVLLLAEHHARKLARRTGRPVAKIDAEAARRLAAYDWPGNVRELQNCIERALALGSHTRISVDDLPERIRAFRTEVTFTATGRPDELITLEELERRYVQQVLAATGNKKTDAARILGIDRRTLYRLLQDHAASAAQPAAE